MSAGAGAAMVGKQIGDYIIEKQLGEGGMGVVFKGVHPALGQIVAIKMLHPNLVKADNIKQRFVREAQAMARLRHPNILQLFNFVENQDGCFIIMEYVEGKTYEDILQERGVIPPDEAIDLVVPCLSALKFAHDQGVIHRDLKPSNFMMLNSGVAKIMDFGTAKMAGASGQQLTAAGMTLGTVVYMSPEQLMGRDLTPAADLYSMGVTLFELCTGQLPFYHDNEMLLMKMIMKEQPKPPSAIYPAIPKKLEEAILRSMDKNPAKRYQTGDEFTAALKACKGGGAPPPPPPVQQQPPPVVAPPPGEVTGPMPAAQPAAPAAGGTSPLVFVGGGVAGVGLIVGIILLATVGVGVGLGVMLPLLLGGAGALVFGLKQGGGAGGGAPLPADARSCPKCGRTLLPTMDACPFCAPAVKHDAGSTAEAKPVLGGPIPPPPAGAAPVPPGTALLDILDGSLKGQRVPLGQGAATVGRADDNSICIKDPSISSHHARIDFYQGKYYLSDLQSSNGTYVNNARIQQAQVNNQDVIAFGSTRVILNCG